MRRKYYEGKKKEKIHLQRTAQVQGNLVIERTLSKVKLEISYTDDAYLGVAIYTFTLSKSETSNSYTPSTLSKR